MDYVVREVRGDPSSTFETRIAVYLNETPRARRPTWAINWSQEQEGEIYPAESVSLMTGVWLVDVAFYGGDGDRSAILLDYDGMVHLDITHRVDYGQGYLTVHRDGVAFVIDASVENLELRRASVPLNAHCATTQWPMIRLRYDQTERRLVDAEPRGSASGRSAVLLAHRAAPDLLFQLMQSRLIRGFVHGADRASHPISAVRADTTCPEASVDGAAGTGSQAPRSRRRASCSSAGPGTAPS